MLNDLIEKIAFVLLGWSLSLLTQFIVDVRSIRKKKKGYLFRLKIILLDYVRQFQVEEVFYEMGGIRTAEASFARFIDSSEELWWKKEEALRVLPPPPRQLDDEFLPILNKYAEIEAESNKFEVSQKLYEANKYLEMYENYYRKASAVIGGGMTLPESSIAAVKEIRASFEKKFQDAYQAVKQA